MVIYSRVVDWILHSFGEDHKKVKKHSSAVVRTEKTAQNIQCVDFIFSWIKNSTCYQFDFNKLSCFFGCHSFNNFYFISFLEAISRIAVCVINSPILVKINNDCLEWHQINKKSSFLSITFREKNRIGGGVNEKSITFLDVSFNSTSITGKTAAIWLCLFEKKKNMDTKCKTRCTQN